MKIMASLGKMLNNLVKVSHQVSHKSFLLVVPFEGELIVCRESDDSSELYREMDFSKGERVVTREYYEFMEGREDELC